MCHEVLQEADSSIFLLICCHGFDFPPCQTRYTHEFALKDVYSLRAGNRFATSREERGLLEHMTCIDCTSGCGRSSSTPFFCFGTLSRNPGGGQAMSSIIRMYRKTPRRANEDCPVRYYEDLLPSSCDPRFLGACINEDSCIARKLHGRTTSHMFAFMCECQGAGASMHDSCISRVSSSFFVLRSCFLARKFPCIHSSRLMRDRASAYIASSTR